MTTPTRAIAQPLPSATVVLVRDGDAGAEVLLVLRHAARSFGASFVFPGGILEPDDLHVAAHMQGLDDAAASRALGLASGGSAYYSAAIRELFEEAGVLLARDADGRWVRSADFDRERDALNDGSLVWARFVDQHRLRLAADALHYFSFWITPREAPRRFSTRFFLALLPPGQVAMHCGGELVDSRWLTPEQALRAHRRDEIDLPFPTEYTLQEMRDKLAPGELTRWAEQRCRDGVVCRLPGVVERNGEREVVMPGDPDYPVSDE